MDRGVVFIDGNNWFHCLKEANVEDRFQLDYSKISQKLLGPRIWIGTRYYIGRVDNRQGATVYADQRRFVANLQRTDSRITVHFGRIEPRVSQSEMAKELRQYLQSLTIKIDSSVRSDLIALAKKHEEVLVWVEKAVDVELAVDMVTMASRDDYDAAYLLSADGDYTAAVQFVRSRGKKVYVASLAYGAQLAKAANSFIHLKPDWFKDCYAS